MSPLLPVGTGLGASQLSLLLKRQLPSAVGEDRGHFTACDGYDFSWPDAAKVGIEATTWAKGRLRKEPVRKHI